MSDRPTGFESEVLSRVTVRPTVNLGESGRDRQVGAQSTDSRRADETTGQRYAV